MMWCPKCLVEYREGFTVCSDCGSTLVEECSQEMVAAVEKSKANKRMAPRKWLQKYRLQILLSTAFIMLFVVAGLRGGFDTDRGSRDFPLLDLSPGESSDLENESSISEAAFQDSTPSPYYQETASLIKKAVRPSDDELLDAAFWTEQENLNPVYLIPYANYYQRDHLLDVNSIPQSGTREGDLVVYKKWGMENFVHEYLNYRSVYIYAEVKGLAYPFKFYFMPEEEYIKWGMRLFGGEMEEWQSFISRLEDFKVVTDKATIIQAAGLSETQAAHWPDGKYIGIEEDQGYRTPYTKYSRHINRVENIRLHDDLGATVTLHYNPEQAYHFTTEYIDVAFLWDDELGFIVESFERRESERVLASVKGDCEIVDVDSRTLPAENPDLFNENGELFELEDGEYSRNQYSTDHRVLMITNRNCYAFDSSTRKLIHSKPLPAFLVSEEEDRTYTGFVVNDDLTELSYIHQYEYPAYYSIYLCPLTGDQEPQKLLALDPEKSEVGQEYYQVARFLDNDRLLMRVGGWEWIYRYEIMDKSGNVLLEMPPKENGPFAGYGGGFADYNDNMMILSSMSGSSGDEGEKIPPKYYLADFDKLSLTRMDWIYSQVPLTDENTVGGEGMSGSIRLALSEDLTHGVFSVCYRGDAGVPYDKTEFYYVDFMEETAALLPQMIENRSGYPKAIVGDYYYFSYDAVSGVDNQRSEVNYSPPIYMAKLSNDN